MQILKHILGQCGESHINIYTALLLVLLAKAVIKLKTKPNE